MVAGSRAFGEQDYPQVNRTFMVNLAGGLLFSLAAALPISLFAPSLVGLYTDSARLYPLAIVYLPVAAFIGVAFAIQNSYTVFLQLIGKANLVVRVTIVQMMINLLFDMLFIVVCGWGLQGAVYATICSYLLSLVMIVPEVRRQWRIFALKSVFRSWFPSLTWHCGKLGLSDATGSFVSVIIFSGINAAAQRLYGADGLVVGRFTGYDGCHLLHAVARHDLPGRERPSRLSHGHQPQPAHRRRLYGHHQSGDGIVTRVAA